MKRSGDEGARETVQKCVQIMKEATDQYGGNVIKTIGDEVMSTFPSADDAMNAGSQMQKRITSNDPVDRVMAMPVAIRIGCHYGPVVVEERDISGSVGYHREPHDVTGQGRPDHYHGGYGSSSSAANGARWCVRSTLRSVRGRSGEVAVFEVLVAARGRDQHAAVDQTGFGPSRILRRSWCCISCGNDEFTLGDGRRQECNPRARGRERRRRQGQVDIAHPRGVSKRSRTVSSTNLIDESTNGTFVQRDDGEEFYVRRDSTELAGTGIISLGRVATKGSELAIDYRIET